MIWLDKSNLVEYTTLILRLNIQWRSVNAMIALIFNLFNIGAIGIVGLAVLVALWALFKK